MIPNPIFWKNTGSSQHELYLNQSILRCQERWQILYQYSPTGLSVTKPLPFKTLWFCKSQLLFFWFSPFTIATAQIEIIGWANIGHFVGSVFGSTLTNDVGRMPFFSSVRRTCKRLIRCWSNVRSPTSTA